MNWPLTFLGVIIILWALMEALWTALWIDGNSGPMTSRLTTLLWNSLRWIDQGKNHRFLSLSGPLILFCTVTTWVILLWLGWSLLFYADPHSLQNTQSQRPTDFSDILWYVAYTLFTVGNGDFSPQGSIWEILSGILAFTGMSLVTLSITYLLQVLSAVVNKRTFASQVMSVGKSPEELLLAQWDGRGFGLIELQLNTWSSQLAALAEQTLAYPILHYYHASHGEKSSAPALAVLDEALSIIAFGVPKEYQPAPTILLAARQAVGGYLSTLQSAFIHAAQEAPPPPDLSRLRQAGIPLVDDESIRQNFKHIEDRRKLLAGMIQKDAWQWPPLGEGEA